MKANIKEIMDKNIIVDGLYHSLFTDHPPIQNDDDIIDLLIKGGVSTISTTVIGDEYKNNLVSFLKEVYNFWALEEAFSDRVSIIHDYDDMLKAKEESKLGIILSTQGADAIEQDLRYVTLLHKLGV